jgi:hypothetical protein
MSESRPPTLDGREDLDARGRLTLSEGQDLPRL